MDSQHDRARAFRALHDRDAPLLRLLNAWDAGSAKVLVAAGAPALGTTSAGVAFALGLPDGERLTRDAMLAAVAAITDAVAVPVSADIEAGYADEPTGVAETVRLALDAGAIGFNLEDGRADGSLTPLDEQVARVRAAAAAVHASGISAFINARTDTLLLGAGDEAETIARLRTYADAGADGLFVPGATDSGLLARLVAATPLPLNVLASAVLPPVEELTRLGVARVSSGSGPARIALSAAYSAAQELLGSPGTYGDGSELSYVEVNRIMGGS